MSLFDRYVFLEISKVLVVGTLAIVGVFFGTVELQNMFEMMNQAGIPFQTVFTIMMLQLPTGMVYCLPAGLVVAALVVLARQNRENEIMALQLQGTPLSRVLLPFLSLGLLCSIFSFLVSDSFAPQARDMSRKLFTIAVGKSERPFPNKSEFRMENDNGALDRIVLLGKEGGKTIHGFVGFDLTQKDGIKVACSGTALWKDYAWNLKDGQLFEFFSDKDNRVQVKFKTMQIPGTSLAKELLKEKYQTTLDKTTAELKADIDLFVKLSREVPPYLLFQYYRRFSHPCSCFFLILAATPLVLLKRRRRIEFPLVYGAVLVVVFFLLQQICMSLVVNNRLDPLVAAWFPACLLCSLGLFTTMFLKRA